MTIENEHTPSPEAPKLIEMPDSIKLKLGDRALGSSVSITSVEQGPQVIPVRRETVTIENFQGDPRRVPGHPSNPTTEMVQAYNDELKSKE